MTQLCNCGSCEQAIERGVEFVCKQIRDGDCPYFVAGVAIAVNATVASAMAMDEKGQHDLIEVIIAGGLYKRIDEIVGPTMQKDIEAINRRIFDAILTANAARKQEDELPKGD